MLLVVTLFTVNMAVIVYLILSTLSLGAKEQRKVDKEIVQREIIATIKKWEVQEWEEQWYNRRSKEITDCVLGQTTLHTVPKRSPIWVRDPQDDKKIVDISKRDGEGNR